MESTEGAPSWVPAALTVLGLPDASHDRFRLVPRYYSRGGSLQTRAGSTRIPSHAQPRGPHVQPTVGCGGGNAIGVMSATNGTFTRGWHLLM